MHQTVTYDFRYYSNDWKVNLPVLLVSRGKKSLLAAADCIVPVKEKCTPSLPPQIYSQEVYNVCRQYLATVRSMKTRPFDIKEEMAHKVEQDFVRMRQIDSAICQDDLHRWLNLVRFVELSYGSNCCTERGWSIVQSLESERMDRNRNK